MAIRVKCTECNENVWSGATEQVFQKRFLSDSKYHALARFYHSSDIVKNDDGEFWGGNKSNVYHHIDVDGVVTVR